MNIKKQNMRFNFQLQPHLTKINFPFAASLPVLVL